MTDARNRVLWSPDYYRDYLADSLGDEHLNEFRDGSPSWFAKRAAMRVAMGLGQCRVFGVDTDGLDVLLSDAMAVGAAEALVEWIESLDEMVRRYPDEHDRMEYVDALDLTLDLLDRCVEVWAAREELSLALARAKASQSQWCEELSNLLWDVEEAYCRLIFDLTDERVIERLAEAAKTRVLKNWRSMIQPEYANSIPVWLDGTLECIAGDLCEKGVNDE